MNIQYVLISEMKTKYLYRRRIILISCLEEFLLLLFMLYVSLIKTQARSFWPIWNKINYNVTVTSVLKQTRLSAMRSNSVGEVITPDNQQNAVSFTFNYKRGQHRENLVLKLFLWINKIRLGKDKKLSTCIQVVPQIWSCENFANILKLFQSF